MGLFYGETDRIWVYYERFMEPEQAGGILMCCDSPEAVSTIQINAICPIDGDWTHFGEIAAQNPYRALAIVYANPEQRREIGLKLRDISHKPVFLCANWRGCQSVDELNEKFGMQGLDGLLLNAEELPICGVLDFADIKQPERKVSILTGFPRLDEVTGGLALGELSVWSGKTGNGKSSLLNQIILSAVEQDYKATLFSGELMPSTLKRWISLAAAGMKADFQQDSKTGEKYGVVPYDIQTKINQWLAGNLFVLDGTNAENDLFSLFEYTVNRFGSKLFVVDNLMTVGLAAKDNDFYRRQGAFVARLSAFAKQHGVHVSLVAHPRKGDAGEFDNDEISGASAIGNLADLILNVRRVEGQEYNTLVSVTKNRETGNLQSIGLNYLPVCRRFFSSDMGELNREYSWAKIGEQTKLKSHT